MRNFDPAYVKGTLDKATANLRYRQFLHLLLWKVMHKIYGYGRAYVMESPHDNLVVVYIISS